MLKPRRYKRVVSAGAPAPSGDPYWTSVSLLTNFENNLTFQDGSTNNFAITRNGVVNPSLNTPFTGGVGGSEYFNGSTGYLTVPLNAALNVGTGDFTFECWVYFNALTLGNIFDGAVNGIAVSLNPSNQLSLGQSNVAYLVADTAAATTGSWFHVVGVRSGTTLSLFKNGTRVATATNSTNFSTTVANRIGWNGVAAYFNGFLSNLRIVKGTAVYDPTLTTLTVPTAPLTAITNTSLLITGTGQGMFNNSTFVDQGPNALTVTATGAPVYSGLSPFGNTYAGSVYINNGVTNRLTTPVSTGFDFGTGDFTIETWVNLTSIAAVEAIVSNYLNSTTGWTIEVTPTSWLFYNGDTNLLTYASTPALNTWYHIAVARSGTSLKMFLNGTQVTSVTNSTNITGSTSGVTIGSLLGSAYPLYAYVSNLRIVKGTAVYTANFTPSTTPLTAITNTSLLVRGDTGAFYDLSNVGNPESGTGSATVTTQVKKFGSESGSFNGTTSYISTPNSSSLQLTNSTAFTLECWIYPTTVSVGRFVFTNYNQSSPYQGYAFGIGCDALNSQLQFWDGGSWRYFGAITANVWTYIAITYQGSGTTGLVFVNGVQQGSAFTVNASISYTAGNALIGAQSASAGFFAGYLDDIRITKGVARYTANFTPPTATFPTA